VLFLHHLRRQPPISNKAKQAKFSQTRDQDLRQRCEQTTISQLFQVLKALFSKVRQVVVINLQEDSKIMPHKIIWQSNQKLSKLQPNQRIC
jgi:acetylglutamate kinase